MPIISHTNERQTVITTFHTSPGQCDDLFDVLSAAYAEFIRHQPGFVGAGLHVNDARTRLANYAQWESREDFLSMLRSEEMRERSRNLMQYCRSFEPVLYDVADVVFPEKPVDGS